MKLTALTMTSFDHFKRGSRGTYPDDGQECPFYEILAAGEHFIALIACRPTPSG
jgi:hypothetical protein